MAVKGIIGDISGLDDLVGTEYWVRARIHHNGKAYSYQMIMLLSSEKVTNEQGYEHTVYTYIGIDFRRLSRSDVYYCSSATKDSILNGKGTKADSWDIHLYYPIEPIPTDEMFHITDNE